MGERRRECCASAPPAFEKSSAPLTASEPLQAAFVAWIGTAKGGTTEPRGERAAGSGFEHRGVEDRGRLWSLARRGHGDRRGAGAGVTQVQAGKAAREVWSAGVCTSRGAHRMTGTFLCEACIYVCCLRWGVGCAALAVGVPGRGGREGCRHRLHTAAFQGTRVINLLCSLSLPWALSPLG